MKNNNLVSAFCYAVGFTGAALIMLVFATPALAQGVVGCDSNGVGTIVNGSSCGCGAGNCASGNCGQGCRLRNRGCARCPDCNHEVCTVKYEKGEETRTCFKVDYKTICVPKVKFPWEDCCKPRCGKPKSVKVLITHKYKCPNCKCKWEVQKPHVQPCDDQFIDGGVYQGEVYQGDQIHSEPAVVPAQDHQNQAVPVIENLDSVPEAPNSTQQKYKDYFAPAKFGKRK